MTEGHGDDVFRYGDRVKYNFSTNIHQNVDHRKLIRHITDLGDIFRNYPEPEARSVEAMLSERLGVGKENVLVTNGATEAIYLIAHTTQRKKSAIVAPTFREYQDGCQVFQHNIEFISSPIDIPNDCNVVWICNPNNPTGKAYETEILSTIISANPEKLFVIDQAYADYSMKLTLTPDVISEHQNVLLLYSLTKRYAIPGLRIGYVVGQEKIINNLREIRMPWSVNSIAIEAARYLLCYSDDYPIDAKSLHMEAMRVSEAFAKMGIAVTPTDCNFFLATLPDRSAAELKEWLIDNYGILIRDASNFETLGNRHFRIAAQSIEENNILISAIKKWISS